MGISIQDILGSSLLESVKGMISQFHMSPEEKAQIQQKFDENADIAKQQERDYDAKLNDIAGQNIRTDSSSSDWFVRRARPLFLWIMGMAIGCSILFFPLVSLATGHGLKPLDIPESYIVIYKYALLGYTVCRSAEKALDKD